MRKSSAPFRGGFFGAVITASALLGRAHAADPCCQNVYYDYIDDTGRLSGGSMIIPVAPLTPDGPFPRLLNPAPSTTTLNNGPSSNRVDIVLVGDGFTAADMALYAQQALSAQTAILAQPPFSEYRSYFNVHRVDVVSIDSGVDNDPTQGISRNTALNMGFWCNGVQRALCVDLGQAFSYALNAPQIEQIFAIANSTTYGGVGYPSSDTATLSGGNGAAAEIAIHEFGHSLGNLADEYDYDGPSVYNGGEPSAANVSVLNETNMLASGTKWASWLATPPGVFDGPVSTYEGANYSVFGIFRPSPNSKMRSLNRPFNAPSAETLVINIYHVVHPIDAATPNNVTLTRHDTPFVQPLQPLSHTLKVQWLINDAPIPGATATTLNLADVIHAPGDFTLMARVTDDTPLVRDEFLRSQWMTETRSWSLHLDPHLIGDLNDDNTVNSFDLAILLGVWGTSLSSADLNDDGVINTFDLAMLLGAWGTSN